MPFDPIKLPQIIFQLPQWQEKQFQSYQQATEKLAKIAKESGKNSERFKDICFSFVQNRATFSVEKIKLPIDIRAFTFVLKMAQFSQAISLTPNVLQHLLTIRNPITKLSLNYLISAYFEQYDKLTKNSESHRYLVEFITTQLQQHFKNKVIFSTSDLARYYQHRQLLFIENAPEKVVEYTKKQRSDLAEIFIELGLNGQLNGEFCKQANAIYYLETLKALPVGKPDPILNEVCKPLVYDVRYQNRKLGHKILEILIDRSQKELGKLTQAWQDVIMQIAGDPRVPRSTQSFQMWWSLLGEARIEQMQIWLNKFNLELFLKILEESGKNDPDMQRMFASRQNFILGLDNQKLIRNSRLFLNSSARQYIYQHYQRNKLPSFASVDGNVSIIYLQLTNGQHIIEGTHNFSIKLLDQMPEFLRVLDYGKSHYERALFSMQLKQYSRLYKTHDTHLKWLYEILKELKETRLEIDISQMFSKENYHHFVQKFGVF